MAIVEFYFIGLPFAPYNVPAFQTLCDEFAQNGIGFMTAVCFIVYRTYLRRMQYLSYFQYKSSFANRNSILTDENLPNNHPVMQIFTSNYYIELKLAR